MNITVGTVWVKKSLLGSLVWAPCAHDLLRTRMQLFCIKSKMAALISKDSLRSKRKGKGRGGGIRGKKEGRRGGTPPQSLLFSLPQVQETVKLLKVKPLANTRTAGCQIHQFIYALKQC